MRIVFSTKAWDDYLEWQKLDRKKLAKINDLIKEITRNALRRARASPKHCATPCSGYWVASHR